MGGNPGYVVRNIAALYDKRQKNGFLNAADQSKYLSEAENSKKT
jgi:hypothetical protein